MQSMDGIPTAPSSPAYSRIASVEPAADVHDHAATDFSDFDMMSSIDSLPREPWACPGNPDDSIGSVAMPSSSASAVSSHGFIMPSLPSLSELSESVPTTGLVGRLHLVVCGGSSRAKLINVLRTEIFHPPCPPFDAEDPMLDPSLDYHICSSSPREHNNLTLVDCDVPVHALATWFETQFRKAANSALQPTIDALIYVIDDDLNENELAALAGAQKYAAIIPVAPPGADSDALHAALRTAGVSPFLKRIWTVAMELAPNYDMTASVVEAPGYRSHVLPPSDMPKFVDSLLGSSGRARAHTSHLYARWVQAQLTVTSPEPPGALVVRVNLRKSLESIGNLDPLGLSHWYTMPRLVGAVIAGMAAAVGLSAAWAKLFPVVPAPPAQCHRHILLDNVLENWTQWLRI